MRTNSIQIFEQLPHNNNNSQDIKCIKWINCIPNVGRIRRFTNNLLAVIIVVDNVETTYV